MGADGRRDQRQVAGFRTRREAEAALANALYELRRGEFVAPDKTTLADFVEEWLLAVRAELAESAWDSYRRLLRGYVLPRLGHVRLVDLTRQRIQATYAELLESGKRNGDGLAPKSVQQVHKTLHRALADAVRWRKLAHNPADAVRGPRVERREPTAWSAEQARAFLGAIVEDRLFADHPARGRPEAVGVAVLVAAEEDAAHRRPHGAQGMSGRCGATMVAWGRT